MSEIDEMGVAGISGFQLPLGAKTRKEAMKRCVDEAGDINEAHLVVFLRGAPETTRQQFFEALDFMQDDIAADLVREHVIREVVRRKINEVVRKKAGGGGYTLYAPNKGKKHGAKAVGTFPTKLAAKRAELARFPPKDPKKLQRLRKEVEKLMKDPKKRAEAEKRAMKQHGTDTPHKPKRAGKARGKHFEGYSRELVERAIISEAVIKHVREGLFREEAPGSQWDEFISKVSQNVIKGDRGFQKIQKRLSAATEGALGKAMRIIQKQLGSEAKIKAAAKPGMTDGGEPFIPFHIGMEAASVGPIYLYIENGKPAIEMSDEARNGLVKVSPEAAKAIRAALAISSDSLNEVEDVSSAVGERDQYLSNLERRIDKMIGSMSPLQISMLKQLLVKKYRSLSR